MKEENNSESLNILKPLLSSLDAKTEHIINKQEKLLNYLNNLHQGIIKRNERNKSK